MNKDSYIIARYDDIDTQVILQGGKIVVKDANEEANVLEEKLEEIDLSKALNEMKDYCDQRFLPLLDVPDLPFKFRSFCMKHRADHKNDN